MGPVVELLRSRHWRRGSRSAIAQCRLTSGHGEVRREDFRAGLRGVDSGAGGWLIVLVSASRLACLSAVGLFDAVALVGGSESHDEA